MFFSRASVLSGNTSSNTMKTLTVKIPETLESRLRRKAKQSDEPVSVLVRRALDRELEANAADFSKLAASYRGMFSGPADLSSREGYRSGDSR